MTLTEITSAMTEITSYRAMRNISCDATTTGTGDAVREATALGANGDIDDDYLCMALYEVGRWPAASE